MSNIFTVTFLVLIISRASSSSTAATLPSDVAALAAFKRAINPSSINPWSCLASWNFSSDPCRPAVPSHFVCGITCDTSSSFARIVAIALDPAGYSGILSPSISNLTSLSHLDLFDNSFYGPIPNFFNLFSFTTLVLSSNSFSGPIPFGAHSFPNLHTLDLSRNSLTGPIPDLATLSNLVSLDLSFNRLSGVLPEFLPPNLVQLALRANSLSGPLKRSTFQPLTSLEVAELAANGFQGKVGAWFFLLPSLQQIDLANNTITSIEVLKPSPSAETGQRLVAVDLSFNRIEGELPPEFAGFPLLAALSARHNRLRGQIPSQYGGKFRRLFLDGNFLNGEVPDGLLGGDVTGSFGDNCLAKCPSTVPLCSPVQKPGSVCKEAYAGVAARPKTPRRPSPATNN